RRPRCSRFRQPSPRSSRGVSPATHILNSSTFFLTPSCWNGRRYDKKVRDALKANGRNKVVVSGLWTEVRNNTFALPGQKTSHVSDAEAQMGKSRPDFTPNLGRRPVAVVC